MPRRAKAPSPAGPAPQVLCVHGSPREGGNTDLLLEAFARGAEEAGARVEHVKCRSLTVRPCTGCGACSADGECVLRDDMDRLYEAVDRAEVLALGAPVYFLGLPSQVKACIDRFQPRWARRYLLGRELGPGRPGAFLSTAGAPVHSVFTCAQRTVEAWFDVLGVECRANLMYENTDEKGAIRGHPSALEEARRTGAALVELARAPR
ncbi:MAG: flavodoxin family protein [Deferrisomatales bacterium]